MTQENFVTTDWLGEHLSDPNLAVIDASWHLPNAGRSGGAEFLERHIPGAVFFDIDRIADTSSGLPHMLPDAANFAREMTELGLGDGLHIVVYDSLGLFAAARVWWTLRVFGVATVQILDGGLPKWLHEGRPLENGAARRAPRPFTPRPAAGFVASLAAVKQALATGSPQLVDARPADRFEGRTPEPRPGLKSGHMPGARNLPATEIIEHGRIKDKPALQAAFKAAGVDFAKPVLTSCGSGVTAAILALAAEELGLSVAGLYDGSWAEWGGRDDCPVVTGPA